MGAIKLLSANVSYLKLFRAVVLDAWNEELKTARNTLARFNVHIAYLNSGFAVALTRVDATFAGRAYAAYGGIYIAASLVWLWLVEGQQPTGSDVLGASLAIIGALVIVGLTART